MAAFIIALLLISLALVALVLQKTYFYLPRKELKRQAARGDHLAKTLFHAATYGRELKLLLWTVIGLSTAGGIVLFARIAPPILGIIAVALVLWLAFMWLPSTRLTTLGAQTAVWSTPVVVWLLRLLHPISEILSGYLGRNPTGPHTGLYEHEDLDDLIERQRHQSDNRIDAQELERMQRALRFGHYHVRDVLVPAKRVKAVNVDEDIGPVLLDELHASGHERFPVYEGKTTNIVGTLAAEAVSDVKKQGKVRTYCDIHLAYLHESDSLSRALRAFYETRQHLFIVVNSFNEYVGIITLTDILHELAGAIEHEAFGHHEDREAVSARHTPKEQEQQPEEKVAEDPTEVVE